MTDFAWLIPLCEDGAPAQGAHAVFQILSSRAGSFALRRSGSTAREPVQLSAQNHFGGRTVHSGLTRLQGLAADTVYDVELTDADGSTVFDRSRVRTLPAEIGGERSPLRLFVGSCFSRDTATEDGNDVHGLHALLRSNPPHLKLLCGDQVYLDMPVRESIPREHAALSRFVLGKYLTNWGALGRGSSGFGDLLRVASSLFLSDDHEFWNNYPNTAIYAPGLYDAEQREVFAQAARAALALFQRLPPSMRVLTLDRGANPLTFVALDGRLRRSSDRAHSGEDLGRLRELLARSPGPVVLALSQPLFDRAHHATIRRWFATHVTDLHLADFADYALLVEAIAACPHDVCVLSGDIHGGRISAQRGARHTLYEVVTSPLSLVGPVEDWGGELPEEEYPDLAGTHAKYRPVEPPRAGPIQSNHGALLSFSRLGRDYKVSVRYLGSSRAQELLRDSVQSTFVLRSKP